MSNQEHNMSFTRWLLLPAYNFENLNRVNTQYLPDNHGGAAEHSCTRQVLAGRSLVHRYLVLGVPLKRHNKHYFHLIQISTPGVGSY